ncbi:hypothetical protein SCHPADRAFT_317931 [Schizopora paradoxa]|uniref:Uncharacterized protein n=1 Tax=Schizopora paradoxa TaxID=27342 RepID=A0A0H2RQQ0_9AGAM|nr:hypothetical protein SCHPADRAFT_317931 [Schizopora paradoxa]
MLYHCLAVAQVHCRLFSFEKPLDGILGTIARPGFAIGAVDEYIERPRTTLSPSSSVLIPRRRRRRQAPRSTSASAAQMDDKARSEVKTQADANEVTYVDITPNPPLVSSEKDDASSISSSLSSMTWSTNYTVSNLPGPGRNLGNLYSWAGTSLERRLGKLAERAAVKKYDEAVAMLQSERRIAAMFWSLDPKKYAKACGIILTCAR